MADTHQDDSFVEFERVQKSYDGEILVVKDLNLKMPKGEFLTMLGPSGSGKTTCLMMLAGFETATHGDIRLDGKSINDIPPHKRGIGMVFQNYALFPHMTIGENLSFPLEVRKMGKSEREEKVMRALDMVEMGAFANRRPAQLSGGQQQRVALARALVFEPELVLMDEPLGALDKQLREKMQFEITHLAHNLGITTVYVTHDQTEALTFADQVVVMQQGEVVQIGTPVELFDRPAHTFVGHFIGSPGMNVLPCTLDGGMAMFNGTAVELEGPVPLGASGNLEIGVRPEFVTIGDSGIPAVVRKVADVGRHLVVEAVAGDHKISAVMNGTAPEKGAQVHLNFRPDQTRLYSDGWLISEAGGKS